MTEQDWLECADPEKMLEVVLDKASDRKLRLFACACAGSYKCCSKDQTEVAYRYADGLSTDGELNREYVHYRVLADYEAHEVASDSNRLTFDQESLYKRDAKEAVREIVEKGGRRLG